MQIIATREQAEQFARDFDWSDTQPRIEDPQFAADNILGELRGEVAEDVGGALRAALVASAERENARRAEAINLPRHASTRDLVDRLDEIAAALRAGGVDLHTAVDAEAAGIIEELKSRGTERALAAVAQWTRAE